MTFGKKKRLKCNMDGSSRLSESDSEAEFIFTVQSKPEPNKSWPTLQLMLMTLAVFAVCTVTTVALWLSGLFSSFSHLNTLGKLGLFFTPFSFDSVKDSPPEPTHSAPEELPFVDDPHAACVRIPTDCRNHLPYRTYSRFLPRALDVNVTIASGCSDHNRRLTTSFNCFLKYPVCSFLYARYVFAFDQ